jgi:LysR family transcriptional regulator, glycine cleavage system transcriptional activator
MARTTPTIDIRLLSALPVFEAAARLGSFTRAASELKLTQGAVSKRIAALEKSMGVMLFVRKGRAVSITQDGSRLAAATVEALNLLDLTRVDVGGGISGMVRVGVLPSLGGLWLAPRIGRFTGAHPGVSVRMTMIDSNFADAHKDPVTWDPSALDVVLTWGRRGWRALVVHPLSAEKMVPVCAPSLANRFPGRQPQDLWRMPRLEHTTRPDAWKGYAAFLKLAKPPEPRVQLYLEHFFMLLMAARAGTGVALVPELFVQEDLQSGQLVALAAGWDTGAGYSAVTTQAAIARPAVAAFVAWVQAEAAAGPR